MPRRWLRRCKGVMDSQPRWARGSRAKASFKMGGRSSSASMAESNCSATCSARRTRAWGFFTLTIQSQIHLRMEKQLVEPAAEGTVFVEDALEFRGHGGDAFLGVRLEAELRNRAGARGGAGLHALVDEQVVVTLAGGEERGAKGEAVDFPFHLQHAARSPDFGDVERDADDNPAEV